jgi:hypothetical protein
MIWRTLGAAMRQCGAEQVPGGKMAPIYNLGSSRGDPSDPSRIGGWKTGHAPSHGAGLVEGISSCLTRQRQPVPRLHVPPGRRSSRAQAAACRLAAFRFAARCRAGAPSTARDVVSHAPCVVRCGLWELGGGACAAIRRRLRLLQRRAPPWSAVNLRPPLGARPGSGRRLGLRTPLG